MKTLEYDPRLPGWVNAVLNSWPLCIDEDSISTVAVAWDDDGIYSPPNGSLFYNGYVMLRLNWPLGIWLHLKPARNQRLQTGFGFKGNGRFGITFRIQTDEEAAAGILGKNSGQATGWNRGTA